MKVYMCVCIVDVRRWECKGVYVCLFMRVYFCVHSCVWICVLHSCVCILCSFMRVYICVHSCVYICVKIDR